MQTKPISNSLLNEKEGQTTLDYYLISTLLFGGFCYLISQNQAIDNQQPREISNS